MKALAEPFLQIVTRSLSMRLSSAPSSRCIVRVSAVVALLCAASAVAAKDGGARRSFTVKDSIEISYIVSPTPSGMVGLADALPTGMPIFSPDGKYFLLLTQRGVLEANNLEATLWLFDKQDVYASVCNGSDAHSLARTLVTLRVGTNTPVISDVRWLADSKRVSFLGKAGTVYQRLFIADIRTGSMSAITKDNEYVSAYDIRDETIAYTALIMDGVSHNTDRRVVSVMGEDIYSLLYPQSKDLDDLDDASVQGYANALHVMRHGQELPVSFGMENRPLRLFIPTLSLSPDGKRLVTVAPVQNFPGEWSEYQPAWESDFLRLSQDNKYALADENPFKASQYVLIDVDTGMVSPLLNAPAGRALGFAVPARAFWFADSRRAILSNSFLPLDEVNEEQEKSRRRQTPAVVMVDVLNRSKRIVTYLPRIPWGAKVWYDVGDVSWSQMKDEIIMTYTGVGDQAGVPAPDRYILKSGEWVKTPLSTLKERQTISDTAELSIDQDLDQPPVLSGHCHGSRSRSVIWDPNPQLKTLRLGKVSLYQWRDKTGDSWSGLLALPPDYDPAVRYPLVIQTHGYDAKRFFSDGEYTTGSGGRALTANGIIVLQMGIQFANFGTPDEASDQVLGFESAIASLAADGLVDRRRVGVIGFSRTCFHVLYALTQRPDLFAAASITDGVSMSYVQYMMSTDAASSLQDEVRQINGGLPFKKDLTNWIQRAPGFNLDKVEAPLFILSLEKGSLISQWESFAGLRILNKPVDMVWLRDENAPHILVKPADRYLSQQGAVDWFVFWLKGDEDSDPTKAKQYARWHELRKLHDRNLSGIDRRSQ
jgi:hypothetical protein